jgi:hypothetical protein
MFLVLKYGTSHRRIIALVLFFLASYQFGEVMIFMTNGAEVAFKFAYISTTMLPPLGVLLISKVMGKQLGYVLFQAVSAMFIGFMIITPQIILSFGFGEYCVRVFEYHPFLSQYWSMFYQGTLIATVLAAVVGFVTSNDAEVRYKLKWIIIAYLLFDGVAMLIAFTNTWFMPSTASLMCALALFASFIFAKISLPKNFINTYTASWNFRKPKSLS